MSPNRVEAVVEVAFFRIPESLHRQQFIAPPVGFPCGMDAFKILSNGRPQFRPYFTGRATQSPWMFPADDRAPGIVIQKPPVRAPIDRHGRLGRQANAKDGEEGRGPVFNGA